MPFQERFVCPMTALPTSRAMPPSSATASSAWPRSTRRPGVARLLPSARIRKGIDVAACDGRVTIDMHVIVEQGVNMASVVRNLTSSVTHLVKQIAELQSVDVKVHIEGLRASR